MTVESLGTGVVTGSVMAWLRISMAPTRTSGGQKNHPSSDHPRHPVFSHSSWLETHTGNLRTGLAASLAGIRPVLSQAPNLFHQALSETPWSYPRFLNLRHAGPLHEKARDLGEESKEPKKDRPVGLQRLDPPGPGVPCVLNLSIETESPRHSWFFSLEE